MEEEIPSTSSQIKTASKSFKRLCTTVQKDFVAEKITSLEFPRFARFLGLEESKIDAVETDCKIKNYGFGETVYQMLVKWEQIKGSGATVQVLISALNCIERNDIVQHLFPDYCQRNQQPLNENLEEMQEKLQKKYRHLMLPRTLWLTKKKFTLEEFYVELTMKKKDKWGKEEDINIQREEIFYKKESENNIKNNRRKMDSPCRILIEGHPGYGKTTLISKLVFDWSREDKYMRDKFDLVFVIALRNFKGNLENHLLQQIKNVNGSDEDKLEAIKEVEGRVLLLLDGLDECKERVKESLRRLFNGEQYPHMTVLVTCRTGFIHFPQESDDNFDIMGTTGFEYHSIWDKRIQIKGISPEKRLEFLQKYLNINLYVMERKFNQFNFKNSNLYECPLFLLLFAIFAKEKKLETIQTKTELYKRFFNFVLSRNLNRENLLKEEFDVFDDKVEDQLGCRNFLFRFGQLCLEKMKMESLIFDERELLECSGGDEIILKLGFVSKELNFDNDEEEEHYEPLHRSFLEFLAAFCLSLLNEAELKREIKELTLKYNLWPTEDQLLYPFLGGLLQENAYKLFNSLSAYTCRIIIFKYLSFSEYFYLEEILKEIPENDDIYKSLIPFVPPNWKRLIYSPVSKRWSGGYLDFLQRKEISNNITLHIPDNLEYIKDSPVHVKNVFVQLEYNDFPLSLLEKKEINCHNLIICCKSRAIFDKLKVVLSKINAGKIFFEFCTEWSLEETSDKFKFYNLITGKNFENFSIYHLQLEITKTVLENNFLSLIEDLIERKKIETGIGIEFYSEGFNSQEVEKMNSFLDFVIKSHLTAIANTNTGDTSITLKINEKHWNYIKLSGYYININTNETNSFSVEHLDIRGLYLDEDNWNWLMKCTNLKRLQCKFSLISEFRKPVFDDWFGFESLELLHINHQRSNIEDFSSFLSVISRFKNLQEIRTQLFNGPEYLFKLLSLVPSIKKICLYETKLDDYFIALKFLEKEFPVKEERVEIELRMPMLVTDEEMENLSLYHFFEILERCCLKNVFVSFSSPIPFDIIDIITPKMRQWISDYFSSREGFQVFLTWEEDPYSPFELRFDSYSKINISCELPDNKLVK